MLASVAMPVESEILRSIILNTAQRPNTSSWQATPFLQSPGQTRVPPPGTQVLGDSPWQRASIPTLPGP